MIDGRRILAIVPVRAGSQRLPGKNVRAMRGKPLVQWTFDQAAGSALVDQTVVSTDDAAVADLARAAGLEVIDRPAELASAEASVIDAIGHALKTVGGDWDYVVLLQPTSPLRTADDIDGAIRLCHERGAPAVFSVSPTLKPGAFHGTFSDFGFITDAFPGKGEAALLNGAVYVGRPERLMADRTFQPPGALAYMMPAERSFDIDTATDFAICEALLSPSAPDR